MTCHIFTKNDHGTDLHFIYLKKEYDGQTPRWNENRGIVEFPICSLRYTDKLNYASLVFDIVQYTYLNF